MLNINVGGRGVSQSHSVRQDSGAAERGTTESAPPPPPPSASLSSPLPGVGSGGRRFAAMRARMSPSSSPAVFPTITQNEVDNAWKKIRQDDTEKSTRSNTKSMSQSKTLDRDETKYRTSVKAWLDDPATSAQLVRQKQEIRDRAVGKLQMLPGDILLRKEAPPQSLAHSITLPFHLKRNLNGIEPNNGDHNIFHVAQWIANKNDTSSETNIEIAEARGGIGTTNALRVLAQSIQVGQYWVYRAKPDYGLPPAARDIILKRRFEEIARSAINAVPPMIGEASSVIAEIFADKKEPYAKSQLSSSMRADGEFVEPTSDSREDAFKLAAAPTSMSHVGETSENTHYRDIKTRENEERGEQRGTERDGGDTCSTFVVRIAQTAALQIAAACYLEQVVDKKNENKQSPLDEDGLKALIHDALHISKDGQMNDNIRHIFNEAFDGFSGLISKNPEGLAPKTIEHFCRDEKDFEFVGVLTIESGDVLQKEDSFDKEGNKISATSALPSGAAMSLQAETVAHTVASVASAAGTATAATPVTSPQMPIQMPPLTPQLISPAPAAPAPSGVAGPASSATRTQRETECCLIS